jgi:ribonuclease BN (tRNA processing enzyme)
MSEVRIQFLGCGDAFGSGGRLQTCMLLDLGTKRALLDCGASSLSGLKRWGISPNHITAILLTHLHGDHFGGLPFFLLDAQLVSKRTQALVIAGPSGTEARVGEAQAILFPGSSSIQPGFPVRYHEWTDNQCAQVDEFTVWPRQVIHASGAPAFALRIECQGKVIAYSGDTEWTDDLIAVAHGADLFICEAYFYDKKMKYHLDYKTVMTHRADLKCRRLILTHMNDDLLRQLERVDIETAEDGKSVSV